MIASAPTILLLALCLVTRLANAATFSITPSDSLSAAIAQLHPGDTLYLHGGLYTEPLISGPITFPSGTSWDAPITIAGAPGETVTFTKPANIQDNSDGSAVRYLVMDHLRLPGWRVAGGAQYIRLSNSEVWGTPGVVMITNETEGVELIGNLLRDAQIGPPSGDGVTTSAYGCYCNGHHMLMDGNTFANNAGYAIHAYLSGGTVNDMVIRNNVFTGNAREDGSRNLTLGVVILAGSRNLFCNNTMRDNPTLHGGPAVSAINGSGNQIMGNTITGTAGPAIEVNESAVGTIISGNTLSGNGAEIVGAGLSQNASGPSAVCPEGGPTPVLKPRPRTKSPSK